MKHLCYDEYCKDFGPHETIQAWETRLFSHPTICFWGKIVKDFLQKMCVFLRCQRLGDSHGTLLVSAFIWGKCLNRKINLPSPDDYGWEWNDRLQLWMPFWTTLKDVSSACSMLLHCSCKKACRGNCKCFKHSLRCTPLCRCEGGCSNTLES